MRKFHRWIMTVVIVTLSYWAVSGIVLESFDMWDPIHDWTVDSGEHFDAMMVSRRGAPVADAAFAPALTTGLRVAQKLAPGAPVTSVELDAKQVLFGLSGWETGQLSVDPRSGVASALPVATYPRDTTHEIIKTLHRGNVIGVWGIFLALFSGVSLALLCVTGVGLYVQMIARRGRAGLRGFFWRGGSESVWRLIHRWVSIVAAAFLLNLSITGSLLAYDEASYRLVPGAPQDQIMFGLFGGKPPVFKGRPPGPAMAAPMPMVTGDLGRMLQTTLAAVRRTQPSAPIVRIRLRVENGVAEGVADLRDAPQLAFNLAGGTPIASPAAPIDPHQFLKALHRGDAFGFDGRWMILATGFSLLFLCVSSIVMYLELHARRRELGRRGLFWR